MPIKKSQKKTSPTKAEAPTKERKRRKIVLKTKPRDPSVLDHDDVLKKVNYVQTQRKDATFKIYSVDSLVIENILRDAGVLFDKRVNNDITHYTIHPGAKEEEGTNALEFLEDLDDEILEDGQIFG